MAYTYKYRIAGKPEARLDGSGCVDHDIYALVSSDTANWAVIPGRHKTVSVPGADLLTALASGTSAQKIVKYKNLLATNLNTSPVSLVGWDSASLASLMAANDAAAAASLAANAFILSVVSGYPVDFAM